MIPWADRLIPEVLQHYPNEPVEAMHYLIDKYEITTTIATHLISVIWSTLHIKYPLNLPIFLINPYTIHIN